MEQHRTKPFLTIGIPTWNRADQLKKCLGSIIPQIINFNMFDCVDIVISDNDSTDHTFEVVSEYMKNYVFIKYFLNDENIGAKNNVLKVIERATGTFIWFMGDDDRMVEGALQRVLALLKQNQSIAIFVGKCILLDANEKELSKVESDLIVGFSEFVSKHTSKSTKLSNIII